MQADPSSVPNSAGRMWAGRVRETQYKVIYSRMTNTVPAGETCALLVLYEKRMSLN